MMTRDRRCYSPRTRSPPLRPIPSGPVRTMSGRSRPAVPPRRREEYHDKSNYHGDDRDIFIQQLSKFNESLRRGESASTKFRWDHLLVQKPGRAAVTQPDYENERTTSCSTSPIEYGLLRDENQYTDRRSPLGFNPHLSERDLGLRNNGEDFGQHRGLSREDKPIGNYGGSSSTVPASARVLKADPGFVVSSGTFSAHGEMGGSDGFGGKPILNPSRIPEVGYHELESYRHVGCGPTEEITELGYRNVVRGRRRDGIVDSNAETFAGTGSSSPRDDFENTALSHQRNHCSLSPNYLDFAGGPLVKEQDEEILDSKTNFLENQKGMAFSREGSQSRTDEFPHSRMTHIQKPNGVFLDGESQLPRLDGGEVLDSKMIYLQNQDVVVLDRENLQLRKDYGLGSYTLSQHDDHAYVSEGSPRQILVAEKLIIGNQSQKGRIIDLRKVKENQRSKALQNSNDLADIHIMSYGDEKYTDENNRQLQQLGVSGFRQHQDWRALKFDELVSQRLRPRTSIFEQGRLSQPFNSSTRKSAKERLGLPRYVSNPKPLLWHNSQKRKKRQKETFSDLHDKQDTVHAQGDDSPEVEEKRAKTEPPEDTKEFKQLVHNAFLKFIKVLNENSANRKKYTERGRTGVIKCCVCGSISKEFVDTQSLAMHAFTSGMVGLRVEHLGLHRALCLLMGWNSMTTSSGSWVRKMLPDAETLAMKEELIIWPPVVFIHNSSIANANSDGRQIVSIEELGAIIRGMGFSQGIDKVCRGKPANQSIMVVMFHGTFSGLQEAERLHQLYAENKHGRAEFEQINSRSCRSGETQKVQADKAQTILFGYLGIADDLHKLDFETKRQCVVKSKKEIQAIADMRT